MKRYEIAQAINGGLMVEDEDGDYVLYDDHDAELRKAYAKTGMDAAAHLNRVQTEAYAEGRKDQAEADRETSPVERLHNICDALSEQMDGSPFSRHEWERIDAENAELRREVQTLRKDAARYHWLRDRRCNNNRWPHITQYPWHESIDGPQQFLPVHDAAGYHPERLDAWIDAGISAQS